MAIHYLIDGYNLLYALKEIPKGTLMEKRAKVLSLLRERVPQGKNSLTVVFDSREGEGNRVKEQGVQVIYTAGETADDRIIHMVRTAANPRIMIVVSNDKGIQHLIKGTGAKFLFVDDFLKPARSSTPRPKPHDMEDDSITEELRRKWL